MIDIAVTFDDGFWAPAYASMRSVCLTTSRPQDLRFHVIHSGLAAGEHFDAIASIGRDYGAALNFIDLDATNILSERIAGFPQIRLRRLNPIVYARLFLGDLLPADLNRVLYLDCDIFVRSPIEALFHAELDGKAIGAVLQPDRMHCIAGKDLTQRSAFSMAEPYYNAGVMLIDLEQYRGMDFALTLNASLTPDELALFYYDQDIINYVFKGRFQELDTRWNLQNPEPAHEVFNPHIVHYSANAKPWLSWSRVAFKRTYRHLMTNDYFYRYRKERQVRRLKRLLRLG